MNNYFGAQIGKRNTNSTTRGCAPGVVGLVFILIAVVIAWSTLSFLQGTPSAQGTILYCRWGRHGVCLPVVSFQTTSGRLITFQSSFGSNTFSPGEAVTVKYYPDNPGDARIDSWETTWLLPSLLTMFGLMILLVGLSEGLRRRPREQTEPQDIFSPEMYQLGEMHQLGSPEAVYRTNALVGIAFILVWNLLVLLFMGGFFYNIFFLNGYFRMPTLPEVMALFGSNMCSLLIPLMLLSVGIASLVSLVLQRHMRLYIYTGGLLLRKRRNGPVQAVPWEQISYVRSYTTRGSKGRTSHHYDIICANGQRLNLGNYIPYEELVACIDHVLIRERLPDLLQRYQQGESVSFGSYLSVNRDGILHFRSLHGHASSYSWSEIDSIRFNDSALHLFLNSCSKPVVLALTWIDNVCLLRALVERVRGE